MSKKNNFISNMFTWKAFTLFVYDYHVLILDGNSELVAHERRDLGNQICLRRCLYQKQ